jgi:hypothetical protein
MRLKPTTALLAFLVPFGALHCSDPGRTDSTLLDSLERVWAPAGEGQQEQTPVPENCRSVAVQRHVRVADTSGEASCLFDGASSQLACRTALGRSGEVTISDFASLSDFVEAGHSLGKITSLRELRRRGDSVWVTNHEYDELGRLVRSREERSEGELVYNYSDFDAAGRPRQALPTRATQQAFGCDAAPMAIEYSTARVSYRYQLSGGCGLTDYSVVEHYDVLGNRVRVERTNLEGAETTFEASAPLSTLLVCD